MAENHNQSCDLDQEIIDWMFDDSLEERWLELVEHSDEQISSSMTRRTIKRDREAGAERLVLDYFATDPVYPPETLRRRFRMHRHVFLRIVDALFNADSYFRQRYDAIGKKGLSPLQKCPAVIRMLAYGVSADDVDDYVRIGETTANECLENFTENVILVFEKEYLRKPNTTDVQRLLQIGEERGFPGLMGSIDCMHWEWKNCPVAWKGMFQSGYHGNPSIILEAVASSDLWIWHAFFGVAGSNNDINVLDRSPVFDEVLEEHAPKVNFTINGNNYNMGYFLADGIYPQWATFVKTISRPQGDKRKLFAKYQELQARFAIVRGPARFFEPKKLGKIMRACIILHNMIVEDERTSYIGNFVELPAYDDVECGISLPELSEESLPAYERYIKNNIQLRDRQTHRQLQEDLIEHIWQFHNTRANSV